MSRRLDLPSAGHCGTLDPLATGLLVVVSGCATRVQDLFTGHDKEYEAVVTFGATSITLDAEGPITAGAEISDPPDEGRIREAIAAFVGEIDQAPPAHSAVRVDGERLFKKARRGEEVEIPLRRVRIDAIELTSFEWPRAGLTVRCGPGTYIRSLARDLGEALGVGGYLSSLRRTRSGGFTVARAELPDAETPCLLTLEEALADHPRVDVALADLPRFLQGREIRLEAPSDAPDDAIVWCDGLVVARSRRLGPDTIRMRRLVRAPAESG